MVASVLLQPARARGITSSGSIALDRTFPGENRLKKSRDFSVIQRDGSKYFSRSFLIFISENKDEPDSSTRIGITVSKKVDKRAVVRNRIKRLIREIFRNHKAFIRSGIDIVIIAKRNSVGVNCNQAEQELLKALRYAGVYDKCLIP